MPWVCMCVHGCASWGEGQRGGAVTRGAGPSPASGLHGGGSGPRGSGGRSFSPGSPCLCVQATSQPGHRPLLAGRSRVRPGVLSPKNFGALLASLSPAASHRSVSSPCCGQREADTRTLGSGTPPQECPRVGRKLRSACLPLPGARPPHAALHHPLPPPSGIPRTPK